MPRSDDDAVTAKGGAKERIKNMRARVAKMMGNPREKELRKLMVEDEQFVHEPGAQWDEYTRAERGPKRPTYQFNRIRITIKRIINNMRNNRPQGKVRAFEDGDKDTAEVNEGLLRNIANQSDFDSITDAAAEHQVSGGYAAWRVVTRYASESAFEQDIFFEPIRNPLCLWCDPAAFDLTGADAKDWFYCDKIPKAEFKARWPKAKPTSFEGEDYFDDDSEWDDGEYVRVGEYWWKEPTKVMRYLLSDGSTIADDDLAEAQQRGLTVVRQRESICNKIYSAIYSGDAELTAPTEFPGYEFPWVRTYGDYVIIDGKVTWSGLTRHCKDAQRAYNLGLTSAYESVARAPLAQVWATPTQAAGLSAEWADADKKNKPFQLYNPDPTAPGPPQRIGGADVPVAHIQMSQIGAEEIKADSGIFDNSLGKTANETSGVAIRARNEQGEIATFNYVDNMAKAVARTWKIALGMIPYVYDTARSLRILGADGGEKYVKVNQPDQQGQVIHDLSRGRYDLVVTVGPNFSTQRQEAVEAYSQMVTQNPQLMPIAGDLIMKAMDLPYSDEISERLKMMLPPQIQESLKEGAPPPEVQQAMAQVDQAMQQVQMQGQLVQQAAQEAEQIKTEAVQAKSEVQAQQAALKVEAANLKTMQANLEADVAQFKQLVAETQVKMIQESSQDNGSDQVMKAFDALQSQMAEFITQSTQVMRQMHEVQKGLQAHPQVIVANEPKPRVVAVKRENGMMIPVYEDQ